MTLSKRAESARAALFERYDTLNVLIEEAESELTHYHIPKGVEYEYSSLYGPDGESGIGMAIGIQKIRGKWRLCHAAYSEHAYHWDGFTWTPLVECSVEERVRAATYILKLRESIVQSSEKFIEATDLAIESVQKALSTLRGDQAVRLLIAERAKLNGKA